MIGRAIVIDRPSAERVAANIRGLGGAWTQIFDQWAATSSPYLVMMAHTHRRMRERAPLSVMVLEGNALREALRMMCRHLFQQKMEWLLCVEKGSEAERVARDELLADSIVEGHA